AVGLVQRLLDVHHSGAGLLAQRLDVSGGVVRHVCVSSEFRGSGLAGGGLVRRGGVRRGGVVGHLRGVGALGADDGSGLLAGLCGGGDLLGVVRHAGGVLGGLDGLVTLLGDDGRGLGALVGLVGGE